MHLHLIGHDDHAADLLPGPVGGRFYEAPGTQTIYPIRSEGRFGSDPREFYLVSQYLYLTFSPSETLLAFDLLLILILLREEDVADGYVDLGDPQTD